jgi:pSer/pThr/pTyr-binding forkhead associated (FHA) protein
MKKVTLYIQGSYDSRTVSVEDELTIGRTDASDLVLEDGGLSRKNTTFFRDGDLILVADENSTNGTFLNGRRLSGPPEELQSGDEIRIGSETRIRVEIEGDEVSEFDQQAPQIEPTPASPVHPASAVVNPQSSAIKNPQSNRPPTILIVAGLMTFAIVVIGLIAFLLVSLSGDNKPRGNGTKPTPVISKTSVIPVRVIDPLGGEDEDDLDDLIASWETAEQEINAGNVSDITVASNDSEEKDLNVTAALLADRQKKALEPRNGETGIRPAGLDVPKELFGDGVIKQKMKLSEMKASGYHQPLDFAELAEKRLKHDLIEMPMASQSFYLDVGGSASDGPFQAFSFQDGDADIQQGSPKYQTLLQLASNFAGQKYDLNNPTDRKQMRIRLLRMFNPKAKPILQELADAYFKKFGRPLRVTSLTRSIDYQISLNATNVNSFKVRGEGSLPPHTSGCAFDLARKHMTAEEQNFVMQKLSEMERANKLDALIEYGVNACFHIFIYFDGNPPRM